MMIKVVSNSAWVACDRCGGESQPVTGSSSSEREKMACWLAEFAGWRTEWLEGIAEIGVAAEDFHFCPGCAGLRVGANASLIEQRRIITDVLANCEPGAFPGSAAAKAESNALSELRAFDAAHPEVIQHLNAERSARLAAEHPYQD